MHQTVDTVEALLGQMKIALAQKDVGQMQFSVGNCLGVTLPPGSLGIFAVEIQSTVQVAEFQLEPGQNMVHDRIS